jgi:hypothetical protein
MTPLTEVQATPRGCERILVACLAEPKGAKPSLGVVVVGMGMADLVATRRFARHGWVAMQIRLIRETAVHTNMRQRYDIYDESGVSRLREAMDFLAGAYGVQRFILMGNCTLANICFNAGVQDARVVGLILTNPHVSNPLTERLSFRLRRHLFRWRSWRRLLTGSMRLRPRAAAVDGGIEWTFKGDVVLPSDFDMRLAALLAARPVRTLIVISAAESGLSYFERHYRRTLDRLSVTHSLRYEVLQTDMHDFSATDTSAEKLNDVISDWVTKSWVSESLQLAREVR